MNDNYRPDRDEHPITGHLRTLGRLTLVGSRAVRCWPSDKIAGPDSDWDYYLDHAEPASLRGPLEAVGLVRLPDTGGPYGEDPAIEGVWRLESVEAFGRAFPHVDVILCETRVADRRLPVLRALQQERPARIGRGIKAERAWGAFWWLAGQMGPAPSGRGGEG